MKNHSLLTTFIAFFAFSYPVTALKAQTDNPKALPELEQVLTAIDQNALKVPKFQVRSVITRVTSPLFWGEAFKPPTPALIVQGKEIRVQQDLAVNDNGRLFVDQLVTYVATIGNLQEHTKYWLDPDQGIGYFLQEKIDYLTKEGTIAQLNDGLPTAHKDTKVRVPLPALGHMQMENEATSKRSEYLRFYGARVTGVQEFGQLQCIRLDWSIAPGKGSYAVKGHVLVCPSRDYKEVYKEVQATSNKPDEPVRQYTEKRVIESFKRFGDAWLPTSARFERQDFYEQGEVRSLQESFRVVSFQSEEETEINIFKPLLSAGTRVFESGGEAKVEVMGSDIAELLQQLRAGNFSSLKEEVRDLSK
jgi:hypothetical protein